MCITGVIAGGHYDQGRNSECKAFYYYFYIQQFCLIDLSDCTSTLMLIMMTVIMIVGFVDDGNSTAAVAEFV